VQKGQANSSFTLAWCHYQNGVSVRYYTKKLTAELQSVVLNMPVFAKNKLPPAAKLLRKAVITINKLAEGKQSNLWLQLRGFSALNIKFIDISIGVSVPNFCLIL
jgi:hypothetical protein